MTEIQKKIKKDCNPIKKALSKKYSIQIFDKSRCREYVTARQFFIGYVMKNFNYSLLQLSIYMNRNPATLINTHQKFNASISYDRAYLEDFEGVSHELDNIRGHVVRKEKYNIKKRIMDRDLFQASDEQVDYIFNILYKNPSLKINK